MNEPNATTILNQPHWTPERAKERGGFHEVWYLKLTQPGEGRSVWLRFSLLDSANGFSRSADTWAVCSQRGPNREVTKVALKQSHEIKAFARGPEGEIRIEDCELSPKRTRGMIRSKGRTIRWDLAIQEGNGTPFNMIPEAFSRLGLVKNTAITVSEHLLFTGTVEIDGQVMTFDHAPGMQGHLSGPRIVHSWVWAHCNSFMTEKGEPAHFIFDGVTSRAPLLGGIPSPKLSSFYFFYQGKPYFFNTLRDSLALRSKNTNREWEFQAERDDLSFHGTVKSEHKDFAGVTFEDTRDSLLYCSNSGLADMRVLVYRNEKLESTFESAGSASFEIVSREKNPYVQLLI